VLELDFLSCQIFALPSTGFELAPLINCSTNRLALCPATYTTRLHPLFKNVASIVEVLPDIRLSDWCCSLSMEQVQIPLREEQKFDSSKDLILTLFGLIFRHIYMRKILLMNTVYIYFFIVYIYIYRYILYIYI
jgi:hypothetical protein